MYLITRKKLNNFDLIESYVYERKKGTKIVENSANRFLFLFLAPSSNG